MGRRRQERAFQSGFYPAGNGLVGPFSLFIDFFPAARAFPRGKPVRRCLCGRFEPSVRARGEVLVRVHAGAAPGVAEPLPSVQKRFDVESARQ